MGLHFFSCLTTSVPFVFSPSNLLPLSRPYLKAVISLKGFSSYSSIHPSLLTSDICPLTTDL